MNTKDLKLFTLEYINLQEGLTKEEKIDMMSFTQLATREEVMSMLLTGKARSIQEDEAKYAKQLFESTPLGSFLNDTVVLSEAAATPLIKIMDPTNPEWQATRSAIKGVLSTAYKGNKELVQKMMDPENHQKLANFLNNATEKGYAGVEKISNALHGKGSIAGVSAFSKAVHGAKALGGANFIKDLASKWASYKVPNVKELPSILGGGVVGKGDSAAQWGAQYDKAVHALNAGVPVAAAVVTALVLMLGRKAYKAYLTKAARACKGTSGAQKDECIRKFKADAIKAKVQALEGGKKACQSAKNPGECIAKIDAKIGAEKANFQKIMTKKNPR